MSPWFVILKSEKTATANHPGDSPDHAATLFRSSAARAMTGVAGSGYSFIVGDAQGRMGSIR